MFISYAHEDINHDVANAQAIGDWLDDEGYDVWWDRHLLFGDVQKALERKVRHAKRVIVLWSPRAAESKWVARECEWAAEGNNLAPVIIEDQPLQPGWECFLWLKLTDFESQKEQLRRRLPPPSLKRGVAVTGLPTPARSFIGREDELARLCRAWDSTAAGADLALKTSVFVLHAIGGAGKTALLQEFLRPLDGGQLAGAHTVYAWSAYSQGSADNRIANADEFIATALGFFGHDLAREPIKDPVDRGRRLAQLVGERRTLMILDGLEPLQDAPHVNDGRLRDRALAEFIKTLARDNKGLLIITSRQELPELATAGAPRVISHALDRVGSADGVKLLAALGVNGKHSELEKAVEEVLGHALTVNLLGAYLNTVHAGDVNQREQFKLGEVEDAPADFVGDQTARYAKRTVRIIEGSIARLEATGSDAETSILRVVGLFNKPAEKEALEALLAEPSLPALTEAFYKHAPEQRKARWNVAAQRLRKLKLIAVEDRNQPGGLDTHPVVRAHFGFQLKAQAPKAYRQAHTRLYDFYRDRGLPRAFHSRIDYENLMRLLHDSNIEFVKNFIEQRGGDLEAFLPSTLNSMQSCFFAITHGCAAGKHDEVFHNLYEICVRRVQNFITRTLHAPNADLAALASFFDKLWSLPASELSDHHKAIASNLAGYALKTLGRLRDAIEPFASSVELLVAKQDWENAAISASSLSDAYLILGDVSKAIEVARSAVAYADYSGNWFRCLAERTALADALHQGGNAEEAIRLFEEAEALDAHGGMLRSVQGYNYCDLLLALGLKVAVMERADLQLAMSDVETHTRDEALRNLAVGRLWAPSDIARDFLDRAVDGLRRANNEDFLPAALLTRAAFYRTDSNFPAAELDLAEVTEIANSGGMLLPLTDYHLEFARLKLTQVEVEGDAALRSVAEAHCNAAEELISSTGYNRRLPELIALRACLAGAISAKSLAPDLDKEGRPIWQDLASTCQGEGRPSPFYGKRRDFYEDSADGNQNEKVGMLFALKRLRAEGIPPRNWPKQHMENFIALAVNWKNNGEFEGAKLHDWLKAGLVELFDPDKFPSKSLLKFQAAKTFFDQRGTTLLTENDIGELVETTTDNLFTGNTEFILDNLPALAVDAGDGRLAGDLLDKTLDAERGIDTLGNWIILASLRGRNDWLTRLLASRTKGIKYSEKRLACYVELSNGVFPLLHAANFGHAETVRLLLDAGADPNQFFEFHKTPLAKWKAAFTSRIPEKISEENGVFPLLQAAEHGHSQVVQLLLDAGANPKQVDGHRGCFPLLLASEKGHAECARLLLNAGADPKQVLKSPENEQHIEDVESGDSPGIDGIFPLQIAAQNGHAVVVRLLLESGANPMQTHKSGTFPLLTASERGHADTVKLLLDAGADPNMVDKQKGTFPLGLPTHEGNAEIVRLLLEAGANPRQVWRQNGTFPLLLSAKEGHTEIVRLLLAFSADPGQTHESGYFPLFLAATLGHAEIVRLLLEAGANPQQIYPESGSFSLLQAAENGHFDVVRLLIEAGANPKQVNKSIGFSPLLMAAQNGYSEIVDFLLKANADPNENVPPHRVTPLLQAAQQGHTKVVRLLLKGGADPRQAAESGNFPLMIAAYGGHREIVELLLAADAAPQQANKNDGVFALQMAAQEGHTEIVRLLLKAGADAKQANKKNGIFALQMAAQAGHVEVARLLLNAGADPNQVNGHLSPLRLAAKSGHTEIVELLLDAGADATTTKKHNGGFPFLAPALNWFYRVRNAFARHWQ